MRYLKMKINYMMTKDFRKEWGVADAIRELVQNCMDNSHCKSTFEFTEDKSLIVTTYNYVLPQEVFALGESQKENSHSRGGFGEGFKLAMLVLAREGNEPALYSGENEWLTGFEDIGMNVPTFYMEASYCGTVESGSGFYRNVQDTTFVVRHLSDEEIGELKHRMPLLAGDPLPVVEKGQVNLIPDRPGQVFVGGLFVSESSGFKYGYDFCPSIVTMGSDRQLADMFGLAWETSKYWARNITGKADLILNMLTEGKRDISSFDIHVSASDAKLITQAFTARFGHVEIKQMGSSLGYGMSVGGGLYNTMTKSGYTQVANKWEEAGTPFKKLEAYFEENKKHMRSKAARNFTILIEEAKQWQRK